MIPRQVEGSFRECGVEFGEEAVSFGNTKLSMYVSLPLSLKINTDYFFLSDF